LNAVFEAAFVKALKKHSAIKKDVERKVRQIMEHPVEFGEPLKGNFRGSYSAAVQRNFILVFLYLGICPRTGDDAFVNCSDCSETPDETVRFILLGPHDQAYGIK